MHVAYMDVSSNSKSSERRGQVCLIQHSSRVFIYSAICMFCCSILLWSIPRRMTSHNAFRSKEISKLSRHVLSTFIILQCLDFASKVVLSISLEQLECLECTTLAPHVVSHSKAGVIISKDYPMLPALSGEHLIFFQIRMYKFQRCCSTMSSRRKRSRIQLASKAWFTNRI